MARPREFDERTTVREIGGVFRHNGYAGSSIDDLTAASGLGRGSLYGAFGSKHELFLRSLDDYDEGMVRRVAQDLEGSDKGALKRLKAHVRGMAVASTRAVTPDGCFLALATAERASTDPAVAKRALATFRAVEALLAEAIEQAQRAGHVDPSADPPTLARALLAAMRGIESLGRAGMTKKELSADADAALTILPAAR